MRETDRCLHKSKTNKVSRVLTCAEVLFFTHECGPRTQESMQTLRSACAGGGIKMFPTRRLLFNELVWTLVDAHVLLLKFARVLDLCGKVGGGV